MPCLQGVRGVSIRTPAHTGALAKRDVSRSYLSVDGDCHAAHMVLIRFTGADSNALITCLTSVIPIYSEAYTVPICGIESKHDLAFGQSRSVLLHVSVDHVSLQDHHSIMSSNAVCRVSGNSLPRRDARLRIP